MADAWLRLARGAALLAGLVLLAVAGSMGLVLAVGDMPTGKAVMATFMGAVLLLAGAGLAVPFSMRAARWLLAAFLLVLVGGASAALLTGPVPLGQRLPQVLACAALVALAVFRILLARRSARARTVRSDVS